MKNKYILRGALLLGSITLIGCGLEATGEEDTVTEMETTVSETSNLPLQYTTHINQDLLDEDELRYQEIMEEVQKDTYTLESPLMILDPYEKTPLSAVVLFETEEPMEITVTVEGKTAETTIPHTISGYYTQHEVPVLGLYADSDNNVVLSGKTESGETTETNLVITTDPLPEDMIEFSVKKADVESMEDGVTFISPSGTYPAAVDSRGDVRWYTTKKSYNQTSRLDNGNMLLATNEDGYERHSHLTEMSMLGKLEQSIRVEMENVIASEPFHHDTIVLPNGNYLALLHDGSDEYVEDEITELDRETGAIVHRLNLKDIFPAEVYEEYDNINADVGDWVHTNAVWKVNGEDAILLSIRNQDAIVKLSYPAGEIEWILAAPEQWPEELEQKVLTSIDDDITYPAGQHAVQELPDQDGNPATMDIMLFDNSLVMTRGNTDNDGAYSRSVQYRINEEEGTVEEIWSYGEERGEDFFSRIVGDADYLPESGNVLTTSGHTVDEEAEEKYSIIVETTKTENPEEVFELHYGPFDIEAYLQVYRSERMPLYPKK